MTAQSQPIAIEAAPVEAWSGAMRAHRYLAPARHLASELQRPEQSVIVREIRRHAECADRSGPTSF